MGFDAEAFLRTGAGYPDVVLRYNGKTVVIIEVKRPGVSLSDPELLEQALRYAEWYRRARGVLFYGVHNMRFVALYRYQEKPASERRTLLDYVSKPGKSNWVPALDFPLPVIPWATSIRDYKAITTNKTARENLRRLLLVLKDLLEGKTLDLSKDVIKTLRELIENAAAKGKHQFKNLYDEDINIQSLVNQWISERGFEKPRNDEELVKYLELMLKEQAYTFTVKLLFYLVLQSIDVEMAEKLKENVGILESANDPQFFKQVADSLFNYAIEKTGDFEEIFGTNNVDKLPIMPASLESYRNIVRYLSQIRWSNISIDVIGRVFEGLIYNERRHLLGQHYTDAKVVDLILMGVFRRKDEPAPLLDPACGSGTFLVRALAYWKAKHPEETRKKRAHELLEGCDIDKLAAMLAKINLYIQALEYIKDQVASGNKWYTPKIYHTDFFKLSLEPRYSYVVTNPPYTRQEEMALAYYSKNYKSLLERSVSDICDWDKRASIYAYFLVRGGKLLANDGRLGFIVENSWLNTEYGAPLKKWLFSNFTVEYLVESLVEKWFEGAAVITNIIIAEKTKSNKDAVTKFIYLKKPLRDIVGDLPPASDKVATLNYYSKISMIYDKADKCGIAQPIIHSSHAEPTQGVNSFGICEDEDIRVVAVKKRLIDLIESRIGKLGLFRGQKTYLDLVLKFIENKDDRLVLLGEVLDIKRGLTTNANELFYLPSKWWNLSKDDADYLELIYSGTSKKILRLSKKYLRRLLRVDHLKGCPYEVKSVPSLGREDYVLWVEGFNNIDDPGTQDYVNWMKNHITQSQGQRGKKGGTKYATLLSQMKEKLTWLKLTSASGGTFIFRSNIDKTFNSWLLGEELSMIEPDQRLYVGFIKSDYKQVEKEILFAILNSIVTYMGIELMGKRLGEGVLYLSTADYEKIPIPNPKRFYEFLARTDKLGSFRQSVKKMLTLVPDRVDREASRPERSIIERFIFEFLGLNTNEIASMYKELVGLVLFRTEKVKELF